MEKTTLPRMSFPEPAHACENDASTGAKSENEFRRQVHSEGPGIRLLPPGGEFAAEVVGIHDERQIERPLPQRKPGGLLAGHAAKANVTSVHNLFLQNHLL